tara:strand:- start:11347 stop:12204 length:858 start_codon:yes stop_codon:yes gene_type:complete
MINIAVTSKPVDGLLYYSCEYCDMLNKAGFPAQVVIIRHRDFSKYDYENAITQKFNTYGPILIDTYIPNDNDVTLIMGRSMLTLSWQSFNDYSEVQQRTLKRLFSGKLISVYSENHPTKYPLAVEFYNPEKIVDLCDTEVYPNGVGKHFEKTINFDIHRHPTQKTQFKHLFLGTNKEYYASVEEVIDEFPDHGILTYDAEYVNIKHNNVFVPVHNLMGLFETYVYTKSTFDPAPRIFQECKYYGKDVIYRRDKNIKDGGSVYWNRDVSKPNIQPILEAVKELNVH